MDECGATTLFRLLLPSISRLVVVVPSVYTLRSFSVVAKPPLRLLLPLIKQRWRGDGGRRGGGVGGIRLLLPLIGRSGRAPSIPSAH